MSKALYGVLGGADPHLLAELASLRAKVRQLEAELAQARSTRQVDLDDELEISLLAAADPALV
jgi:hypothetical protein